MADDAIKVEIKGLKEVQHKMDTIVTGLNGPPMVNAMREATMLVTRDARRFAPVDTGRLRASIVPEVRQGIAGAAGGVQGVVGSNVKYAPYVELGTRPHWPPPGALARWAALHHMPEFLVARAIAMRGTKAHEFLQRAFRENKERIVNTINAAVQRIIGGKG